MFVRKALVVLALLLFFFLAVDSLILDSPTMDEQNHLARGLAYVHTGDPRLSVEHPPLINSLSALPLITIPDIQLPTDQPSWERQPPDVFWYVFAEELVWNLNRDLDLQEIFFLARLPIVFLVMALGLTAWHFARELWGVWAGLFALFLILFDPNILANGRYVTTDLGGTLFAFLATYLLWRLWQSPGWNWRRWFWAALVIGLAFSSKLSTLIYPLIWIILAILPLGYGRTDTLKRGALLRLTQLLLAGIFALFVVWAIFSFETGNFLFISEQAADLNVFQGPMPTFLSGLERILLLNEGGRPGYLLGEFSNEGFPLYFPVVFLAKTPLIIIILGLISSVLLLIFRGTRKRALFLLLPPVLYFLAINQSALNLGYRHLLPLIPFIYMIIAGLLCAEARQWIMEFLPTAGTGRRSSMNLSIVFAGVVVIFLIGIDLWIHPHYLSYFNLISGGPENGHQIVIDSNIDWGQDLLRLKDWMADNDVENINLAWFGTADPDYYGINYEPLPGFPRAEFYSKWSAPPFDVANPEPGIYAISVSNLQELSLAEKNVYPWFRSQEPDDRVGYSILIFEVQ